MAGGRNISPNVRRPWLNGGYAPTGPNRTISHRKTNGLTINLNIFTYFNTHTILGGQDGRNAENRWNGTGPSAWRTDHRGDTGLRAREARARLPAASEAPGPDAAAAAAADAVRVAGRRATKPRSGGGRGARHLQLGGRIKARVINAMLWPPSTINALS